MLSRSIAPLEGIHLSNSVDQSSVRVLAVIVLHKMRPKESASFRTLRAAISGFQDGQADIKILLYDNTPRGQDPGALPPDVEYKADVENGGLARAYNYALEIASKERFDWLLTLDQDTSLPIDFLRKLCGAIMVVAPLNNVAAIVPFLSDDGRVISPFTVTNHWVRTKPFPAGFTGVPLETVYAANSGSAIKVKALKTVGGYDPGFYLDYSDIVMYHRLHRNNFSTYIAGAIYLGHEISGSDLTARSTPPRYEGAVCAEGEFYDEYLGRLERMVLLLKTLCRPAYRIWRMGGSLPYFIISVRNLCRRLFYSRKKRMENWKQSVRGC